MLEKVVDVFIVKKGKDKNLTSIFFLIVVILLIGFIMLVKMLSINVDNSQEIKEKLIGKTINLDGDKMEFTMENLLDVQIISRKTERNVKDTVKVKMKINRDESIENIDTTVYLIYKDGQWNYDEIICDDLCGVTEDKEVEEYLINYFEEKGVEINNDIEIFPSTIRKISNVKLSGESIYLGKEFLCDVVLYNGVCIQNCKLKGIIYYDNERLVIKDIDIDSKSNVYKDKGEDIKSIEDIIGDELKREGVFKLKDSSKCKEIYLEPAEKFIESFEVKDYRVKDDYSIRAEVSGEVYLEKYKEDFKFDGIVFVSGNLSEGHRKNAKDITIYDVSLH